MSELFTATVASVLGSVVGALVSVPLTLWLTRRSQQHQTPGSAAGPQVVVTVRVVERESARSTPPARPRSRPSPASSSSDGSDTVGLLMFAFIAMAAVVAGYLRVQDTALLVATAITSFSLTTALAGLVTAAALGVRFGPGVKSQAVTNVLLGIAGIVGINLMSHPPFVPTDTDVTSVLAMNSTLTFSQLLSDVPLDVISFIATQIIGLVFLMPGMMLVALHSMKLYATQRVVVAVSNDPSADPWISRRILRVGPTPSACFKTGACLTVASLLFVSGAFFTILTDWFPRVMAGALS